jgi:hypothetical protein
MGNRICIAMFIDSKILNSVAGFCEHGIKIQLERNLLKVWETVSLSEMIFFLGVSPRTPLK